jgi:hypothetical protein
MQVCKDLSNYSTFQITNTPAANFGQKLQQNMLASFKQHKLLALLGVCSIIKQVRGTNFRRHYGEENTVVVSGLKNIGKSITLIKLSQKEFLQ